METLTSKISLNDLFVGEQNHRLDIAIALHVAKWTKFRNKNSSCGPSIPEGEATLWEYSFVPPQFNGSRAHWRKVPSFATSVDALLPLMAGLQVTIDQVPELGAWQVIVDGTPAVKVTDAVLSRAICIALLRVNGVEVEC